MSLTELMSAANLDQYAQVALIVFMAAFLAIVWRTFSHRNRARYEDADRMLPLKDD